MFASWCTKTIRNEAVPSSLRDCIHDVTISKSTETNYVSIRMSFTKSKPKPKMLAHMAASLYYRWWREDSVRSSKKTNSILFAFSNLDAIRNVYFSKMCSAKHHFRRILISENSPKMHIIKNHFLRCITLWKRICKIANKNAYAWRNVHQTTQ